MQTWRMPIVVAINPDQVGCIKPVAAVRQLLRIELSGATGSVRLM